MTWLVKAFADFFMAVGFIVTFGAVYLLYFSNGQVENLSTLWVFIPAAVFSLLRGEFCHYPKEKDNTNG